MTRDWFEAQLRQLADLRDAPADTEAHWTALQDIPAQVFKPAVLHALKTRAWFPKPAELRADCDAVRRAEGPAQAVHPTSRLVPIDGVKTFRIPNPFVPDGSADVVITVTSDYRPCCDDCDDTGWVMCWCGDTLPPSPWWYRATCGRHHSHPSHHFARPCPCVATNAVIQRRIAARNAKYAQEPERVA